MKNSKMRDLNQTFDTEKGDLKLVCFFFCVGVVLAIALVLPTMTTG